MEDIAPGLLNRTRQTFQELIEGDSRIKEIFRLIREGKATYLEAEKYAVLIGEALSQAFAKNFAADSLPDGRMYYNIAQRVIRPLLEEDYQLVAAAAEQIQTALNKAAGLGIKAQSTKLDEDRLAGIIDKVSNAENFDDVAWVLQDPVTNFSLHTVDETLRVNVDFQGKAGLRPRVHRRAERRCCRWCSSLEGEYTYPDVPEDIYRRHENCRCSVTYEPGDGRRQDVWSKRWN